MKSITIGLVGTDWKVAASARYYAERGSGEELAFGMTPTEALARLEQREAAINTNLAQESADEIAFLALGAADALRDCRDADLSKFGGYMGFIGEVIRCAPLLTARWSQMQTGEFGGVWLYDVTERFGREWAEEILNGTREDPSERLEYIIADEMEKWS
ncbi:MAG: hypothetical protein JSS33_00360 [Proteobacteria bacterium]|nr:hypothetical protein [Pseudomonadota bacterium]